MNRLSPQERRQEQTRQTIIDTAHRIIVAQGVAGLSIRALADSIDYTPGALYKYFDSKDALVDAVRAACFHNLNAFIATRIQSATTASEMLLTAGLAYIEYAEQNPQDYHLMFNVEPSPATSGDQRATAMSALLQIVQCGLAQGEFKLQADYDQTALVYHCWATVYGIATLCSTVLVEEREELLTVSRVILQKVIDGFTA